MAADLLLGFVLGVVVVVFVLPIKGIVFTFLEQKKQIEFLRDGGAERGTEYPNRKEDS